MKYKDWNSKKNAELKENRGISFEEIVLAITQGKLLDIIAHHNQKEYPDQKLLIVQVYDYVYLVPFVEKKSTIFLKTIIPSRKATKTYLRTRKEL